MVMTTTATIVVEASGVARGGRSSIDDMYEAGGNRHRHDQTRHAHQMVVTDVEASTFVIAFTSRVRALAHVRPKARALRRQRSMKLCCRLLPTLFVASCTLERVSEIPEAEALTLEELGGPVTLQLSTDRLTLSFGECERLRTAVTILLDNRPPTESDYGGVFTSTSSGGHSENTCTSPRFAWDTRRWPPTASVLSLQDVSANWTISMDLTGILASQFVRAPGPVRAGDTITVSLSPAPADANLAAVTAQLDASTSLAVTVSGAQLQVTVPSATAPGEHVLTLQAQVRYHIDCNIPGGCEGPPPVFRRTDVPLVVSP